MGEESGDVNRRHSGGIGSLSNAPMLVPPSTITWVEAMNRGMSVAFEGDLDGTKIRRSEKSIVKQYPAQGH